MRIYKYIPLIIILLLSINQNSSGQDPERQKNFTEGKISGIIIDEKTKQPIEYAAVSLLNKKDEQVINGTVTDSKGQFLLEKISPGFYKLKISFIGYETKFIDSIRINPKTPSADLGKISVSVTELTTEDILVEDEKPEFETKIDRKVFNVQKNIISQGGTALDVLQNIPTVNVDIDGNISLRGSSNITILIDGKPSGLGTASKLQQIPASSIESVELITNPSAKFNPEGMSGIINIILKKNTMSETSALFMLGVGTRDKYNAGLNLNYKRNGWLLNGVYSYRKGRTPWDGTNLRQNFSEDSSYSLNQFMNSWMNMEMHLGKMGIEYLLDKYNSFSITSTLNIMGNSSWENIFFNELHASGVLTNTYNRITNGTRNSINLDGNLNYLHKFSKPGHTLTADFNISTSEDKDSALYSQEAGITTTSELQKTNSTGKNIIAIFQSDYTHPFSKDFKIETGYKYSLNHTDDDYIFQNYIDSLQLWETDPGVTNRFKYKEQTHAFYATYSRAINNLGFQIGLRLEQTFMNSELVTTTNKYDRNYFSFFPSIHISQKFPDLHEVQLSYSRRIKRPRYHELNPFTEYSDPLNVRTGNPDLKPEYINSFELGYSKFWEDVTIITTAYYRYNTDVIYRYRTVDTAGKSVTSFTNISNTSSYGFEIISKLKLFEIMSITANTDIYQIALDASNLNTEQPKKDKFNYNFRASFDITPIKDVKDFQIQLSGMYRSPVPMPQGTRIEMYWVDFGMKKDFFDGALSLGFNIQDIFDTRKFGVNISDYNYNSEVRRKRESQIATLIISYKIGKMTEQRKKPPVKRENDNIDIDM